MTSAALLLLASVSPSVSSSESSPELNEEDMQGLFSDWDRLSVCEAGSSPVPRSLRKGQSPGLELRSSCLSQWKSDVFTRLFWSMGSRGSGWAWDGHRSDQNPFARCSATSLSTLLLSPNPSSWASAVSLRSDVLCSRPGSLCSNNSLQASAPGVLRGHEPRLQLASTLSISTVCLISLPAGLMSSGGFPSIGTDSSHGRPQSSKLNSFWLHTSPIPRISCSQKSGGGPALLESGHGKDNMGHKPFAANSRDNGGICGP